MCVKIGAEEKKEGKKERKKRRTLLFQRNVSRRCLHVVVSLSVP